MHSIGRGFFGNVVGAGAAGLPAPSLFHSHPSHSGTEQLHLVRRLKLNRFPYNLVAQRR